MLLVRAFKQHLDFSRNALSRNVNKLETSFVYPPHDLDTLLFYVLFLGPCYALPPSFMNIVISVILLTNKQIN